jgi:hypothetical protein
MILTDSIVTLLPDDPANGPRPVSDDPYADLDGLMCVIEALCPVWPTRPIDRRAGTYRL